LHAEKVQLHAEKVQLELTYKPMMDQFIDECRQTARAAELEGNAAAAAADLARMKANAVAAAADAANAATEVAAKAQAVVADTAVKAQNLGGAAVNGTKDFFGNLAEKTVSTLESLSPGRKRKPETLEEILSRKPDVEVATSKELQAWLVDYRRAGGEINNGEINNKIIMTVRAKEDAAMADAERVTDAATKMQATIRGQQSRKAMLNDAQDSDAVAAAALTDRVFAGVRENLETADAEKAEEQKVADLEKANDEKKPSIGGGFKDALKKAGSSLSEPFALCTQHRKSSLAMPPPAVKA